MKDFQEAVINRRTNYKLDKNGKVTVGNSDELSKISASIKEWGDNK